MAKLAGTVKGEKVEYSYQEEDVNRRVDIASGTTLEQGQGSAKSRRGTGNKSK